MKTSQENENGKRKNFYIDRQSDADIDAYSKDANFPVSQVLCSLIRLVKGRPIQNGCDECVRRDIRRVFEIEDFEKLVLDVVNALSKKYRQDEARPNIWIGGKIGVYATTRVADEMLQETLGIVSVLSVERDLSRVVVVSPSEVKLDANMRKSWEKRGIMFTTLNGLRDTMKDVEKRCSSRAKKELNAGETAPAGPVGE